MYQVDSRDRLVELRDLPQSSVDAPIPVIVGDEHSEVLIAEDVPQAADVTRVLEKMSSIAQEEDGEPVLDWDGETSELHIVDPFFAYYLRWGTL